MRSMTAPGRIIETGVAMLLAGMLAPSVCLAQSAGYQEFLNRQRRALAPMQADYEKTVSAQAGTPAMRSYQDRLAALSQLVRLLCDRTQSGLSESLEEILGTAPPKPAPARARAQVAAPAVAILSQYERRFAGPLPLPEVSTEEAALLRRYYETNWRTGETYVAERCKVFGALGDHYRQAAELALVLPLLRVSDGEWTSARIGELAEWLRTQKSLQIAEELALRAKRPRTAHAFRVYWAQAATGKKEEMTFLQYVPPMAEQLVQMKDYAGAMAIMRAGIDQAAKDGDRKTEDLLRLKLGELLDRMGHPALAAEEARRVLANAKDPPTVGRSALLRLKWLYKAEQFEQVITEGEGYRSDKRCGKYLPQIIYVSWVAHRQKNQREQAAKLQELFLSKFPDHPLGADMHFASAMTALAAGDYPEALRRLEIVRYRYPESRLVAKAKDIAERIGRTTANRTPKMPSEK